MQPKSGQGVRWHRLPEGTFLVPKCFSQRTKYVKADTSLHPSPLEYNLAPLFAQFMEHANLPSSELVPYDPSKFEGYEGPPLPADEDARCATIQAHLPPVLVCCCPPWSKGVSSSQQQLLQHHAVPSYNRPLMQYVCLCLLSGILLRPAASGFVCNFMASAELAKCCKSSIRWRLMRICMASAAQMLHACDQNQSEQPSFSPCTDR